MKRALIKNNLMLMISAFLVFFIVVLTSLYFFWQQQSKTLVSFVLSEVKLEYEQFEGTYSAFINTFDNDSGRRITLLTADGIVIIDSHDDRTGQDKSERPEIKNLGSVATRTSETIGTELVYMATELDDGLILRVAIPLESQVAMYTRVMWMLILTSVVVIAIYYVTLIKINKNLLAPWEKVKSGLRNLSTGDYQVMAPTSPYPEINDLLDDMNQINLETDQHLRSIETYQIQLKEILNELKQGVMLFDDQERLVYYNQDAEAFFHLTEDSYDKPSYYTIRDVDFKRVISEVNRDQQNRVFDMKHEGKILEIKAFHVDTEGRNKTKATVLILVKDVTQERAIEQIKKDFFSHASHELKSPLTAIRGLSELIEHGLISESEYQKTAHDIVLHTETMAALVEDMLMLSRLENLKEKSYMEVKLHDVLSQVIKQLTSIAHQKEIDIQVKTKDIIGVCDAVDMHKLFKNVIENAIKYSEPKKTIKIMLEKYEHEVIFSCQDQGIGIAEEHQQRVFERFYRVDKGKLDGGTGLGLAIVKHIALKYNGSVDLKSSLTRGTLVTVKMTI
jgi:two-component system phosphate regulon sensor histidine kinase PhoR